LLGVASATGAAGIAYAVTARVVSQALPAHEDLIADDLADAETQFMHLDGHRMAYRERGNGEEVLCLIHGFGGSLHTWDAMQPSCATLYRTLAIDLWGFGASDRPPALTPQDWTRQVLGMLDALGVARATLIGHSLGGRVVVSTAVQAPERVCGLVLLDSDGAQRLHQWPLLWVMARHRLSLRTMLRLLRQQPELVERLLRYTYGPGFPVTPAMVERYQRALCVRGTQQSWWHLGQHYPADDFVGMLPRVRCPSLVFWGKEDRVTPLEQSHQVVDGFPRVELVVLPGVGHVPQEECPDLVLDYLVPFLGRCT
jgi:pimeloyl-ACP methyl ester carboxylesterase